MATEMEFTEEEIGALSSLREVLKDVLHERHNFDNDKYLIKWLRARKLNVSKTENMIRQSLTFRDENSLDYIDKWRMPEAFEKYLPYGIFGEDTQGRPVIYMRFGRTDLRGISQCASKADFLRQMEFQYQSAVKQCRIQSLKYGREIDQCVFVVDLENLTIQTHFTTRTLSYLQSLIRSSEENYPEFTAMAIILTNSPFFHLCWNLMSNFIDEGTKSKIHFVRPSEYREKMPRLISREFLPECYGGDACSPDRFCSDAVNMGGTVPEKYYLRNTTQTELTLVSVRARGTAEVPVSVPEAGSILYWVFRTDSYNINFSVYHLPTVAAPSSGSRSVAEPRCVLSPQRYESHLVPEQSYLMCPLPGTYVLHFDNTYSWIHVKNVRYFYNVVAPTTSFE